MDTLDEYIHIVEENRKLKGEILEILKTKILKQQANEFAKFRNASKYVDPDSFIFPESSDEEDEERNPLHFETFSDDDSRHYSLLRDASIKAADELNKHFSE